MQIVRLCAGNCSSAAAAVAAWQCADTGELCDNSQIAATTLFASSSAAAPSRFLCTEKAWADKRSLY